MLSQLIYHIFSIAILLTFTSTKVYGVACDIYETPCLDFPYSWCCPNNRYCGSIDFTCTDSAPINVGMIVGAVFSVAIAIGVAVGCYIFLRRRRQMLIVQTSTSAPQQQQQQQSSSTIIMPGQQPYGYPPPNPYQQPYGYPPPNPYQQ